MTYDAKTEFDKAISESEVLLDQDELARLIQERFGTDETNEPDGAPGEEQEPVTPTTEPPVEQPDEGGDSAPAQEPPPSDSFIYDDGLTISKDLARSYADFEAMLEANPALREAIQTTLNQQSEPSLPAKPTPEELDLDDPAVKFLWDQYQELSNRVQSTEDHVRIQTQSQTQSLVNTAVEAFMEKNSLTVEDMNKIRQVAGSIVNSTTAPITDPVTGLQHPPDPLTAITQALDMAYWYLPEFREKAIAAQINQNKVDNTKKSKLSSLGGASKSASRTPPAPTTREEIQKAMVEEIASHMGVQPSS